MASNTTKTYDVCIVGAGFVGSVLALSLAKDGMSVALIDQTPINEAQQKDPRTTAYAHASVQLFKNLGLWHHLEPHGHPIAEIRVSDHTSYSFVHYGPDQTMGSPMGVIIPNAHIKSVLGNALQSAHIDVYAPMTINHWHEDNHSVTITLSDDRILSSSLLVGADGRLSKLRDEAKMPFYTWDYHQTALVGFIDHEFPHNNHAFEHFLPTGPLALLPMGSHKSSFVWTVKNTILDHYTSLFDEAFAREIEGHFKPTLGTITLTSPVSVYPLSGTYVPSLRRGRLVLVGDSGHAIHPVAGQGLNLGLRDCALLHDLLIAGKKTGLDLGSDTVIGQYNRQRQMDIISMTALTDGIVRLFSNDIKLLKYVRRAGLDIVQNIPFLKQILVDRARGMFKNRGTLLR